MRRKVVSQEFAVIGLGRFGTSLARTLVENGHSVLGIDRDMDLVQRYSHIITQTVQLDSTDEVALADVDIASFGCVAVAIGQDFEANLLTTVSLKSLGVRRVITKATTLLQQKILQKVGADSVVLPEVDGGVRLANQLTRPAVVDHMPLNSSTEVSRISCPDWAVGRSGPELFLARGNGLSIIAVCRNEEVKVSFEKEFSLQKGDDLVVIGSISEVQKFIDR